MRTIRYACPIAVVAALLSPAASFAGSVALTDFGSRASGRGTAVVAIADDPSTIYFNPANIARLPGLQFDVGVTGILPRWEYTPLEGGETTQSETGLVTPAYLSLSYNAGEVGFGTLAFGLGVYVPFGSAFGWPEDWAGREQVRKISLRVYEVNPVLALRPNEHIAFGAGFRYLPASVYLSRAVRFGPGAEGDVELGGTGSGIGFNAGVTIMPSDRVAFALSYRSGPTLELEGDSDFDFPPPFDTAAVDRPVSAELPLAHMIRLGAAFEATPALTISADFEVQQWSRYESLRIELQNPDGTADVIDSPRDSRDSFAWRVGLEYGVTESLLVRAGYVYDRRTLPEETVNPAPPDSDRYLATLGFSYRFGDLGGMRDFGVHVHFYNVFFARRTSTTSEMPGEWGGAWPLGTMAYSFGLSLGGRFDVGPSARAAGDKRQASSRRLDPDALRLARADKE